MAIKTNYMQRMEVRCMCGLWGRLVGTKEYKAEVVGSDPYADIAVLKMKTKDIFIPVNIIHFILNFGFFMYLHDSTHSE